jgi:hypothetical protein
MRSRLIMAALAGGAALALSQPAAAFDDSHCCAGTVYVHHHIYKPARYKHVYHLHRPGPRHVHVYHHADGCCAVPPRRNYFAAGYRWQWRNW